MGSNFCGEVSNIKADGSGKKSFCIFTLPDSMQKKAEGGRRMQGKTRCSTLDKPLLTVITVVFNGAKHIEESILSVVNQSYDNIEYLIIDGGSSDSTLEIIKKYEDNIDYWVSEPDEGIYDAMNKGLSLATDKSWLLVLGCDDLLSDITDLIPLLSEDLHTIVTDVIQLDESSNIKRYYKCYLPSTNLERDFFKFPLHHQGFLVKKTEKLDLYHSELGIHTDLYFMLKNLDLDLGVKKLNAAISIYRTGGESDFFSKKNLVSIFKVARKANLNVFKATLYNPLGVFRMLLKVVLGANLISLFRRLKRYVRF